MKAAILIFALSLRCFGAISLVNHTVTCTSLPCTVTSTGTGNQMLVTVDASVTPGGIKLGSTSFVLQSGANGSPLTNTASGNHLSVYLISSTASGQTSITCTSACGTVAHVTAWEVSGTNGLDHIAICAVPSGGSGTICENNAGNFPLFNTYSPGYNAEFVVTAWTCSGSASSLSGSSWTNTNFANGEAVGELITSTTASVTAAVDSGCGNASGIIVGLQGSGATQSCTADANYYDYATEQASSGNPSVTAWVNGTSDLLAAAPWCVADCTYSSVGYGAQTLTQTSVIGNTGSTAGQPYISYLIGPTAVGSATLTFTLSGTRTNSQVAYIDFTPSAGCTFSHDVDSALAASATGATITTPSITPATGAVVVNFTAVESHTTSVGSPWACLTYSGSGETLSCYTGNSVNSFSYVLSGSGTINNNITQLSSNPWQAIMASFKLTGSAPANKPGIALVY